MIVKIFKLSLLFVLFLVCSSVVIACVCQPPPYMSEEMLKDYYQRRFSGAVFTGKIKSIVVIPGSPRPKVKNERFPLVELQRVELLIDVEQFWLGVDSREIKITTLGESSCAGGWKKDVTEFFIATRREGKLHIDACDFNYLIWKGTYPNKEWADYTFKILGPSKAFPKNEIERN